MISLRVSPSVSVDKRLYSLLSSHLVLTYTNSITPRTEISVQQFENNLHKQKAPPLQPRARALEKPHRWVYRLVSVVVLLLCGKPPTREIRAVLVGYHSATSKCYSRAQE